jgi:transmembrane sensor
MMKRGDKDILTFDKILLLPDYKDYIKDNLSGANSCGKYESEEGNRQRTELEKASLISQLLTSHKKIKFPDEIKKKQVARLLARIKSEERSNQRSAVPLILRIAAVALVLITLSILFFKRGLLQFSNQQHQQLELIVPSGEKSQLILDDGTKVWINSESRLLYPVGFRGNDRSVILEGEAYFDVSKIQHTTFTVYTQDVKVKVLGTKFNVKSYPKDQTIETTVVEGLVRVEDDEEKIRFSPVLLKTDERMVFRKDETREPLTDAPANISNEIGQNEQQVPVKEILISHVNTDNITSWKDHLLVFDNETLEEIAVKMSRWYKVQIEIMEPGLKTHRYTGKFVNNETLDQVLEAINLTTPIQYKIRQNSVQIWSRKKKQQ